MTPALSSALGEPTGQGWVQIGELGIAFVLSLAIGAERELRQKSAGVRTYSLVGVGSALFVLVSKYGFTDVLGHDTVLDPSRVAAQIVSGVGFIGGGLIFVRRDTVKGLTTAASVWLVAAVGSAAGAGLPLLAVAVTVIYFVVVLALRPLTRALRRLSPDTAALRVTYLDGRGLLRDIVAQATAHGFAVAELTTFAVDPVAVEAHHDDDARLPTVGVAMQLSGRGDLGELTSVLSEVDGIVGVRTGSDDPDD
ncbi:MgtC/SapB family protein [Jatrophihabitans endophyticus]|uniref:MgtC/SapB family protein n=1 Tax=Jatrophihabitans endophyticus TaxID=1206085 RepID=UPI0019E4847B|nr:MgtC/SapB family protein [Jatrophihabitans endophyticus]MBE7187318.1 MgtC/SapB family protein [Jatrophihabitans endophyticus]